MAQVIEYEFNGHKVTVIRPEKPNGEWIWKTEFLYAFDKAEVELLERGYTRVYYDVSDQYGCDRAIRLMYKFYKHVIKAFALSEQCFLFGFSRGGIYAFNYALFYPETVKKIYLDAPVLDLISWPTTAHPKEYAEMLDCYDLTEETLLNFRGMPSENLEEFFGLNIPLLLVAGGADEVVPFEKNSGKMIEYCKAHGIELEYYVKEGGFHHPHSLEDVSPILRFVCGEEKRFVALGDSIVHGVEADRPENSFVRLVAKGLGYTNVYNYGSNGTTVAVQQDWRPTVSTSVYVDETPRAEFALIAGGVNDYTRNVELGSVADKTETTFYGALDRLFSKAKQKYEKICVITPIPRKGEGKNAKGYTLDDYRQAIRLRAKEYGLFVIEGEGLGVDPANDEQWKLFMHDDVHPNSAGHRLYANYILEKLKNF